jgi:hypothetical protein
MQAELDAIAVAVAEPDRRAVWGRGSFGHSLGAQSTDIAARFRTLDASPRCSDRD